MKAAGKYLLWGLALADLTGGLGYLGIRDWSGEEYTANSLLYFGLPMIAVLLITRSWVLGFGAQAVVCEAAVSLAGVVYRRMVGTGPAATGVREDGGGDPWPNDAANSS